RCPDGAQALCVRVEFLRPFEHFEIPEQVPHDEQEQDQAGHGHDDLFADQRARQAQQPAHQGSGGRGQGRGDDTCTTGGQARRAHTSRREEAMAIQSALVVSTTYDVQGRRIREYKGVVRGITVRAPTIAQGILGGLKSIVGGRIGAYTEMCEQARQAAYDLMLEHARELGANAVVGVAFDASEVAARASATEVLCYGTAVVLE